MKTKSPLQILNAELNTCKANAPREKVMVASGWFIKETAEQTKKDLKEFKAFVKEKFRQQASDLVVYFGHSRQKAETEASGGKYVFHTQNSGSDTVKSPMGLFDADTVDNDLSAVDNAIRTYYGITTEKETANVQTQ